jgi:hypothetical protein
MPSLRLELFLFAPPARKVDVSRWWRKERRKAQRVERHLLLSFEITAYSSGA